MKYQQGAIKYDLEDIESPEEFVSEEENVILTSKINSRTRGIGGVAVALRKGESIDSLLKRFKKSVIESDILTEYHESLSFVKPSVSRRQKKINRKFKARRAEANKY